MALDPHNLLDGCHLLLQTVAERALQSPQPFQIVYGLRTEEEEAQAVASGHSETMQSRHLADPNYDNVAMAFDFACLVDGEINWDVSDADGGNYGRAAAQILAAAEAIGVHLLWGGAKVGAWVDGQVSHFRDWGHIELDPAWYA